MNFVTELTFSANWKRETYDSILIIIDWLTKMVYYELGMVTIDTPALAEVIINKLVWHYGISDSIVNDWNSVFISKFWFLLCYFWEIKRKLFIVFHPQTDGLIERQNSTIDADLQAFDNFEEDNWATLLPMAKFVYNDTKNASIDHTVFELNCSYHLQSSYKQVVNPCSKLKSANKLSIKLGELITVCGGKFYHTQKPWKRHHNKATKPRRYVQDDKICLNSKYI